MIEAPAQMREDEAPVATPRHVVTKRLRVAVFGYYGSSNLGNDGTLAAFAQALQRVAPNAAVTCLCAGPSDTARDFNMEVVNFRLVQPETAPKGGLMRLPGWGLRRVLGFFRALRLAGRYDAIVAAGTGLLDDFCERPTGTPWTVFKWTLAARLRGTPFAMLSVGAGPIVHPASRFLFLTGAKLAAWRSYRDQESWDFMQRAGVDVSKDTVTPDLAFSLPLPKPSLAERPLTIGIGVMPYKGWRDDAEDVYAGYLLKLRDVALAQLRAGRGVRLFIGQASDEKAVLDLKQLISAAQPGAQIAYEPSRSLEELMAHMSQADIVVATRFHNIVCALKLAKPTISLEYQSKNSRLMEDMGQGAFAGSADTFTVEATLAKIERALAEREAISRQIAARLEDYRAILAAQEDALADFLERA